ncbi:hypothetical protein RUM43_003542 [Polyplax serrata]|uniref:G-protein coupled receptors family 1 profile domain-containing protein n=1 Tax=Polyplax serrata TaxID=468196 RepID=A0AAN8S6J0_POLSC
MSFKDLCDNGSFLDPKFNGTVGGYLVSPELYSNPLNVVQRIFFGILFTFLSTVSIVGNGLALLTVSNRRLQVLYRCCVVSQCIGDMLTAVFVGLNSLSNFIQDTIDWKFGAFMCRWIPYVTTMSVLLSSMILTCIAIDRYQGVVLLSGKWDPKFSMAVLIVSFIWIAAAGTTVPTFLGYNQISVCFIDFDENSSFHGHLCLANHTISNYYFFSVFTLIFLPLLIAFTFVYGAIARMMWLKRRREKETQMSVSASTLDTNVGTEAGQEQIVRPTAESKPKSKSPGGHSKKRVRTFTIILVIMVTFIICRLPQWIFIVVTTLPWHQLSGNFWWSVKYLLSALSLANTTINPFIYSFLNQVTNLKSNLTAGLKNFKMKRIRVNILSPK